MMKRKLLDLAPYAIFIVFAFWILAIKNGFMLRWYDEMSLFTPGMDSLRQFLSYPGGLIRFAATFLTQLLYIPMIGATVLIAIWLLMAWISGMAFGLKGKSSAIRLLIPLCMLASVLHLDEAALMFESQGYVFYNSLGFTVSVALYLICIRLKGKTILQCAAVLIMPLLYPVFGFFALLPTVMCVAPLAATTATTRNPWPAIAAAASLILVFTVPQIYYRHFPGTTVDNDYLYLKGLPELTFNDYDLYLWWPLLAAAALLLIFSISASLSDLRKTGSSNAVYWSSMALLAFGIILCLKEDGRKSEQLRATVIMTQAIADHNWRKAVNVMSLTKESANYSMCVLDNLARTYCDLERRPLGEMMTGGSDFRHDEDFTITAFVNVPVNHHIGRFNQSHRWATEHNVQYGNKVYFIKYTVLNALMNGDIELAKRFNRLLERTMFHSRWAQEINTYLENPSAIASFPDYDRLMYLRTEEIFRGE